MLAGLLMAAQAVPVAAPRCDDRNGDLGASQCWSAIGEGADAKLNKVWPDVLRAARDADKAFSPTPRKDRASAAADLLAAQRAWLTYRATQCRLEGDWAQGGSLENVIDAQCYAELTEKRVDALRGTAADFRER